LKPDTLEIINEREDFYLVGLKANQKELYEDMANVPNYTKQTHDHNTVDEHGGRVDTRVYSSYEIGNEYFDGRWKKSGFTTLIVVNRERFFKNPQKRKNKGKVEYIEREVNTDYFLSNKKATIEAEAKELFEAVRGHWNVEVNNHIRDVTLKEDKLKSKLDNFHENISLVRTLVIKLLSRSLVSNFAALLDTFADSFEALVVFFEQAYKT
jgi:predicted transposase YbfD/YdcC